MTRHTRNWAGNYTYAATASHTPRDTDELQGIIRQDGPFTVIGTRHSFNGVADTTGQHISLARFDRVLALDPDRLTVTVEGGIRYGELSRHLDDRGFALRNLASLPHISVAGACATGTHGSGDTLGSLATAVQAIELVTAAGDVLRASRDTHGDAFHGMVVALGALGVVTQLTLDIVPSFRVRQDVYEHLPFDELEANFDDVTSGGYSVSLFTNWSGDTVDQAWVKRLAAHDTAETATPTWFGGTLARHALHPIRSMSPEPCTPQLGVAGPWHERLPHFRANFTPSSGNELQSEYFVPRAHAAPAIAALRRMSADIAPLVQVSEVRTVAADDLWLSPCCGRASVAVHFTWHPDEPAVRALLPQLEARLREFDARPHWAKLFTITPALLQDSYERLADFRALATSLDPHGKFRNAFLTDCLWRGAAS